MTTYFLAVGINHYTDRAFRALSCCENDATELHSLFKRNLELGDRARKLVGVVSIADVKNELRRIGQEIRNGDTFVFFFAGHGYQHPRKEDQYLLFPDAEAVLVNKGHRDGMLALSALRDLTEHWTGVARVFILDACRSWLPSRGAEGARFNNEAALAYFASRDPGFGPELTNTPDNSATSGGALPPVILNATRDGQEARELEDRQRGVLALALEQSLENQQKTGQVVYLGAGLLGDVSHRMTELLQHGRLGVEQTPFLTPPTAQVLLFKPPRAAASEPPALDDDNDETDWAIACAKDTLEAYEDYARRKPPGKHRAEALKRITKWSQLQPLGIQLTQQPEPQQEPTLQLNSSSISGVTAPLSGSYETRANKILRVGVMSAIALFSIYWSISALFLENPILAYLSQTPKPLSTFRDKLRGGGEGPAMVVIPVGAFDMGSNDSHASSDEKPVHRVSIKQAFAIGKTEVTQKDWRQVMGSDLSYFKGCDDCPVERVSWNDAQSYIKKLNELTGKTTYRLPSEAEWEYACRGGKTKEAYCGGDDLSAVAWFREEKTRPVAQKASNAWGLYDMSGNVMEFVKDEFHTNYSGAPSDGAPWISGDYPGKKVARGGVEVGPSSARSSARLSVDANDRDALLGFRVAKSIP